MKWFRVHEPNSKDTTKMCISVLNTFDLRDYGHIRWPQNVIQFGNIFIESYVVFNETLRLTEIRWKKKKISCCNLKAHVNGNDGEYIVIYCQMQNTFFNLIHRFSPVEYWRKKDTISFSTWFDGWNASNASNTRQILYFTLSFFFIIWYAAPVWSKRHRWNGKQKKKIEQQWEWEREKNTTKYKTRSLHRRLIWMQFLLSIEKYRNHEKHNVKIMDFRRLCSIDRSNNLTLDDFCNRFLSKFNG